MNPNDAISSSNTLHVDAKPVSMRLPAGSAIFATRGEVWITQEGMIDDIILGPGQRFDVPNREKLVVSATRESADLFIAAPPAARAHRQRDVYDFARSHALQLRHDELARLTNAAAMKVQTLAARWRNLRLLWPRTSAS